MSHLLLIASGTIHLGDTIVTGPRLLWRPEAPAADLLADAGTRATLLSITETALAQSLPPASMGETVRRSLRQDLSVPVDHTDRMVPLIEGIEAELATAEAGPRSPRAATLRCFSPICGGAPGPSFRARAQPPKGWPSAS